MEGICLCRQLGSVWSPSQLQMDAELPKGTFKAP